LKGYIALEDGTVFEGKSFGSQGETVGEVVFNTSMFGYQEILTDPSYASQIVTMTYPLIGNYGINEEDIESDRIHLSGFLVKEACRYPSNFTSVKSLGTYLQEHSIIGIEGIDTRAITRHIRLAGAMKACICASEKTPVIDDLVDKARAWVGTVGVDSVKGVTCKKAYEFTGTPGRTKKGDDRFSIVAMDFGIKFNILRILRALGCRITVVPASTTAAEILAYNPDGIFLSNGPGDPEGVTYAIETIRQLIGKKPIFGICLGHQLLTLALGGRTYKLKFGHHGGNHPVRKVKTGEIEITAQNHCFCADMESLKKCGATTTHINLNDQTSEGMMVESQSLFSVQYHPEASPGPHDSGYLFTQFFDLMQHNRISKQ
jgi:carbamoyl-phosphate synthase small subunit